MISILAPGARRDQRRGEPLSALVGERMRLFPASGEINRHLSTDAKSILARVRAQLPSAGTGDRPDGWSVDGI